MASNNQSVTVNDIKAVLDHLSDRFDRLNVRVTNLEGQNEHGQQINQEMNDDIGYLRREMECLTQLLKAQDDKINRLSQEGKTMNN